jgi:CheY-like chemotaxis protein
MLQQARILLVDDDQDFLDLYKEMLGQHLPSLPEVRTAASGPRALAMLEAEPYNLMIVDLQMPKMDGLQVLSIARRKYPQMRLVVLTAIRDEQFRTRAYALGVDQYWIKPESDQEMGLFIESIESLLSREAEGGFRGVQSKSLVDIIQLECLSQNSVMLKITNGMAEGRIWIQRGEVVDAEAGELKAEPAFRRMLSWKTGSFEGLPGDPSRERTIFTSYQGLLLDTAQALDEAASAAAEQSAAVEKNVERGEAEPRLADFGNLEGVEFVLGTTTEKKETPTFWGLENPKPVAAWVTECMGQFEALGERMQFGQLQQVVGTSLQHRVVIAPCGKTSVCVGFAATLGGEQVRETMKSILSRWVF